MVIDWQAMARRLSKPWWGNLAPNRYTFESPSGRAGAGLIVGQNYGAWNLALMQQGSLQNPKDHEGHTKLFIYFQQAKKAGAHEILGQPLESYTCLMQPLEFYKWVNSLKPKEIPTDAKRHLSSLMEGLLNDMRAEKQI